MALFSVRLVLRGCKNGIFKMCDSMIEEDALSNCCSPLAT